MNSLSIDRKNLLKAFDILDKIKKSNFHAIEKYYKFDIVQDKVLISATNLDIDIHVSLYHLSENLTNGVSSFLLNKSVKKDIKSLKDSIVEIKFDTDQIVVNGLSKCTEDVKEFPKMMKLGYHFMTGTNQMLKEFADLENYCSTDTLRPNLNGICFYEHNGFLNLVATSAYMIKEVKMNFCESKLSKQLFIIHRDCISAINKLKLDPQKFDIFARHNEKGEIESVGFLFSTDSFIITIITKVVNDNFPNYDVVFPNKSDMDCSVVFSDTSAIINDLKNCDKFPYTEIAINKNKANITAFNIVTDDKYASESNVESYTTKFELYREQYAIGFDLQLMKTFLNSLPQSTPIFISKNMFYAEYEDTRVLSMARIVNLNLIVLSPDGIKIDNNTYANYYEAKKAINLWCERYAAQGYYSSNNGRISLEDLPNHCKIISI